MKKTGTIRGFDRLAGVYDGLVRLVYGKSLKKAQTDFLPRLGKVKRALVLGGGTGWFLEALLRDCEVESVVYIEASQKMMEMSQQRIEERMPEEMHRVSWIQQKWSQELVEGQFDLVVTHCFLDLFGPTQIPLVMQELKACLEENGTWYFSDFRKASNWPMSWVSGALIWTMYRFFRNIAGIDARKLPDFDTGFAAIGMDTDWEKCWFGGMVEARMLKPEK